MAQIADQTWPVPQPVRVVRVRRETPGVATFEVTTGSPFAFAPGQFNMLYAFGLGEVAISISGDPAEQDRIAHTVRAVGVVSGALARLRRGAIIGVRGPYGSCWPVAEAEGSDVVIVAGGLGLAPLRPAIHRVLALRERYGRVVLLYGARGPSDILYRRDLEKWRRRLDVDIEVTVDHAAADWRGNGRCAGVDLTHLIRSAAHSSVGLRPGNHDAFYDRRTA
jgi:NAD(P)H-flavin reductase